MSGPVILGFGDGSLAGVVRSDAGGLILHSGEVMPAGDPRIEPEATGWRATGGGGLDLVFEPLGDPAEFADGTREWLCRVRGTAAGIEVDVLGNAVVEPTPPRRPKRFGLERSISAWLSEELGVALRARRPARAKHHEAEELAGFVLRGSPPAPHPIDEPRLSTAYAANGRHRRAGLELWEDEEAEYPLRLAGEALGEGDLELADGMRLRCAFLVWRYAGRVGAGRYDIVLPGS
ncbi:MAG: hypothetical protein QOD61_2858 [Solirubrobacteraceae bacterium]|nr:hypothetical protein [Solirubrobacteraceae bacterium]